MLILLPPVSPMSLLQNPMILMGIVAVGLMYGMPKLMENSMFHQSRLLWVGEANHDAVDPEMKEEFEKQQKGSSIANALTGQGSGGFDAASWLAGAGSKDTGVDTTPKGGSTGKSSGMENKGGKKRRG